MRVKQNLDQMPPPPSDNPSAELLRLVTAFSTDVEHIIQGRESYERLIQRCRPAYASFKHDIRSTAPRMRPFEKPELDTGASIDIADDSVSDLVNMELSRSSAKTMYLRDVRHHIER